MDVLFQYLPLIIILLVLAAAIVYMRRPGKAPPPKTWLDPRAVAIATPLIAIVQFGKLMETSAISAAQPAPNVGQVSGVTSCDTRLTIGISALAGTRTSWSQEAPKAAPPPTMKFLLRKVCKKGICAAFPGPTN